MLVELKRFSLPPGQRVLLKDVTWQEFEAILEDLGEARGSRIAYEGKTLEMMAPLPEHETRKVLIGDFLKALMEELEVEFWSLGSTTFKNELMGEGIEPDDCFYIENEAKVRGKEPIDLKIDPPPDLAIEIDVTSRTHPSIYQNLGVRELWRFEKGNLKIYELRNGEYVEAEFSHHFPNLPLSEVLPQYRDRAVTQGRNKTMKAFRAWVQNRLKQKGRDEILEAVRESREAFQRGDVKSGTVAELIQELAEK